jgi:cysteinyl-tRNA synthetase
MIQIYNTLSRQKEPLRPLQDNKVRMYVCGMTVYDYCHVGHARVMVAFDVVARYLRWRGYEVTYVRNITDIDDKIIQRAQQNGEDMGALTARFIKAMHEDADALGVLRPDLEPRATDYIPQIVAITERLLQRGYAYVADNGDVYYAVHTFQGYGKLSGKKPDELRAGSRVEIGELKRDPLDFALWKSAKPGEPSWDSPWGPGRPGWHIECSAMSSECLGNHFDIHGGGMDLQFPHHENEIAQSEGASGETFVNCWMHNGFVRINEEKMSKSLGNFFTVREVLTRYSPETVRCFILASHYRSPLNYSEQNLETAGHSLARLYTALRGLALATPPEQEGFTARFCAAMDDDFNTPEAMAVLFDLSKEINRLRETDMAAAGGLAALLKNLGGVLGLAQADPESYFQAAPAEISAQEIEQLIAARQAARVRKDWKESDRLRDELKQRGIALEDTAHGTIWRKG